MLHNIATCVSWFFFCISQMVLWAIANKEGDAGYNIVFMLLKNGKMGKEGNYG
jgi:hypothetical protein